MRTRSFLLGSILLGVFALAACSSDDTSASSSGNTTSTGSGASACNDDPFACPSGQTCWIDQSGKAYACLASGAGKAGDACKNYGGQATCGDGLTCFAVPGYDACTPFCDPSGTAHPCADGAPCVQLQLPGTAATIFACQPPMQQGTGGAGGAGAGGSTTSSTGGSGGAGGAPGTGGAGGA
jgi:hypothetical protein